MSEAIEAIAPEAGNGDGNPPSAEEQPKAPSPETSEQEASGEGAAGDPEAAAEEIEFDFGGNKLRVPKGAIPEDVAEQLDKFTKGTWSDYTRRSQEVADARKALEAEQSAVRKLGEIRGDALAAYSDGLRLRAEIQQLQSVNLAALWQSEPDRARQISDALAQKQAEFQNAVAKVGEHETRAAAEEQQHVARLAEEGRQKVAKLAKGFDEAKVIAYATATYGIPEEQARQWPLNPAGAVMAWKAMQWDALQAKAAPAARPPAPPAAPVASIKPRSAPVEKDPDKMSDAEWFAWRNRQLAKRQG